MYASTAGRGETRPTTPIAMSIVPTTGISTQAHDSGMPATAK